MSLAQLRIDDGPHTMDGLRLIARDDNKQVEAVMSRKVMDIWAASVAEDAKVFSEVNTTRSED